MWLPMQQCNDYEKDGRDRSHRLSVAGLRFLLSIGDAGSRRSGCDAEFKMIQGVLCCKAQSLVVQLTPAALCRHTLE